MQKNKLTKILINLGLSENEAKVYFASLSLGPSTILKIARTAEIKRTTVYSVVESLRQKGLMNIELRGWKKLYTVESPEKLKFILENKKNELQDSMPEFMAMQNLKESGSFIKYYEGLESIKSIYEGLLKDIKSGEDYLVIGNQEQWFNLDKKYFLNFIKRRAKLNIKIRMLLQDSKIAREHKKIEKNYNEKIKILPSKINLTTNLVIIPRKIVIHQLTPPIMAMVIENKNIIQMHREFFEIMWDSIK